VPDRIIKATLAAEDKRFYEHDGIDTISVLRQVLTNIRDKKIKGGASTLTMQLAKRLFTESEKTVGRKLADAAMAVQIERHYSKNAILEMYLNQVYYGAQAYGIQRAAEVYFGKALHELTWGEAAALARCVRMPGRETPFLDIEAATRNRDQVLKNLLEEKWVTNDQYNRAIAEDLGSQLASPAEQKSESEKKAPYFVDYVLEQVHEKCPELDLTDGGYKIYTSLNYDMQKVAEEEVRNLVREHRGDRVRTGAFLLTDRAGRIQAMVGGVDYERNQFNMVTHGRRQPGSAFKPFIYSVALDTGAIQYGQDLRNEPPEGIYDPSTRKKWEPKNSDGTRGGMIDMHTAFIFSKNLPAIDVLVNHLPPAKFVRLAKPEFGFTSELGANYSIALGTSEVTPLELAGGYSVFMNQGERHPSYGIVNIEAPDGHTVRSFVPDSVPSGMQKITMEMMDRLLRDVVQQGTATRASNVPNARGKTGTTNDNRDAWFCGYTDELLGIGWISGETPSGPRKGTWLYPEMSRNVFGGTVTIQMWRGIVRRCQRMIKEEEGPNPEYSFRSNRSQDDSVSSDTGAADPDVAPDAVTPDVTEPVVEPDPSEPPPTDVSPTPRGRGREPGIQAGNEFVEVSICPDSGLLAASTCPESVPTRFRKGRAPSRYCRLNHN
ncbi:MAG: transglycosylase domain-containing protein, partial [Armatimonadetes bacterium]|nr:transglycosylase domain-containing protein [Armatimonadota bacterium]